MGFNFHMEFRQSLGSGSVRPNSRSPYYLFALIHVLPGSVRRKSGSIRPDNYM